MTYVILALGALGLVLTAGGVLALMLETVRGKEDRWQVLLVSGTVYLLAFGSEPPAAWAALWQTDAASWGVSLRALALGVFVSVLSRTHIHKCRGGRK